MTAMALKKKNNMKKGPFKMKSPAKFFAKLPKGKMTIQDFASAAKPNRGKIRMKSPANKLSRTSFTNPLGKIMATPLGQALRNTNVFKNARERSRNRVQKKSTGLRGHIKRLFS